MKKFIHLLFLLTALNANAQEINFEWNKILGNTGKTSGLSIRCDSAGFIYASGAFEGVLIFNGNSFTSAGGKDGYLFKLDSLGNLLWSKQFSSEKNVSINSITIDQNNNVVILGDYSVQVSFDTLLRTNNLDTIYSSNVFIAKYNPDGYLLWTKNTGGVSYDGNSIAVDKNNDLLIAGKSIDISLFDALNPIQTLDSMLHSYPGGSYWGYYHPQVNFVAKCNSNGDLAWIINAGGNPEKIISDHLNNILVTGNFRGDTDFNGTWVTKIGFETSYLVQYTSNGQLNWIKTSGGSSNWNAGYGLAVDAFNNIYQSGQISGNEPVFDGNVVKPFVGSDAFLSKYDVVGNLVWYKLIGTPTTMNGQHNFNAGKALKMDANGDLLLIGYFSDTLTFGATTLQSNGASDLLLLKFNSIGEVIASSQYSDYGWVEGTDIDLDKNEDLYLTGYTTLDQWNSNFPSYAFIGKVRKSIPTSPLSVQETTKLNTVFVYPNPSSGIIHLKFTNSNLENKIEVFSIDGRKINEFISLGSTFSFEIKENGIYLISIEIAGEVITQRIRID